MKQSDTIFPKPIAVAVRRALFGDVAALTTPVLFKPNVRTTDVVKVPFSLFMKDGK